MRAALGSLSTGRLYSSAVDIVSRLRARRLVAEITSGEFPKPGSAFYIGFDPTASSLHLGNLQGLIVSTHLMLAGYRPILLVGGATARVGDPSFRDSAKQRLADDAIRRNSLAIQAQLKSIMSTGLERVESQAKDHGIAFSEKILVLDNHEWQSELRLLDFLDSVGTRMRLSSMLSRESVQRRLQAAEGMSFKEFTYQLMQGYDYYHLWTHLGCRLQLGGSDQWGNMLSGVELIGKLAGETAAAMTFPLLTCSADGSKMGKSAGNAVWLDPGLTSPFDFYQHLLRMSDEDATRLLSLLTFLELERIEEIVRRHRENPEARLAQQILARHVTLFVHGKRETDDAIDASKLLYEEYSDAVLSQEHHRRLLERTLRQSNRLLQVRPDMDDAQSLLTFLSWSLADSSYSKSKLKNLAQAGGIYIDGRRVSCLQVPLLRLVQRPTFLRIGKLEHYLIVPRSQVYQHN